MVRDRREVEGTRELLAALGAAALVVVLDSDPLAARKTLGIGRPVAHALGAGVEGVDRVDMEITEPRPPQGIVVIARDRRCGAWIGRGGTPRCESQERETGGGDSASQHGRGAAHSTTAGGRFQGEAGRRRGPTGKAPLQQV